jgi:GMP synthase (glutamine-hydrolysing)
MATPRVLIVEGNIAQVRERHVTAGGRVTSAAYSALLQELAPTLACDVVYPADAAPRLPAGVALGDYDGVAITGSALNVYDGGAAIDRQIELARQVFAAGVPLFGSCWGLQVAVTAAGGVIRRNPKGREFGFARRLALTAAGRAHAMYADKPDVFEAICVHLDDVEALPAGAIVLAGNDVSAVQAVVFSSQRGVFWGTQYHPEYSFADLAATARRYGTALVKEGLFESEAGLATFADEMRQLEQRPPPKHLLWRYGLGAALADPRPRYTELRQWLATLVLPRRARR